MDIGLCVISEKNGETIIEYSGANTPLWIVRNEKNKIYPIGFSKKTTPKSG